MEEYATFCTDCNESTEEVFDKSSGDTICSECGLVLESRSIDDTAEWRTFANESSNSVRVGGPTNPLLSDGGIFTFVSKPKGGGGDFQSSSSSVSPKQNRNLDPNRRLTQAFQTIATMADRLGLLATIKDRANEICKKVEDLKSGKGRKRDALLAACLYIACRLEDNPRTVKEICSVANGASRKEIGREKNFIVEQLDLAVDMGIVHANDYMRRFCSTFGMTKQAIKAAEEAVKKAEGFDIRRSPTSIAAAVVYIITQLSNDKKFLRDIALTTGACENAIRDAFKDLHPHLSKIIPIWYAKEEDIGKLCFP